MLKRFLVIFEPFILTLLGTVILASLLPPRGAAVPVFGAIADAAIVLLFFLHGAKLSREAILAGAKNWRLHLAVFASTYILFPIFGLGIAALPFLAPPVAAGLLFLTLLPSTVQSSIAFTAIARGNVAAAVCSASLSNLVGIVLTPALAALLQVRPASGYASPEDIERLPAAAKYRSNYERFLANPKPTKALVLGEDGGFFSNGSGSLAELHQLFERCHGDGHQECWLYSWGKEVVWSTDKAQRISRAKLMPLPR